MKHRLITVALLLGTLAFYSLGMDSWGALAFVAGAVLEAGFWVRIRRPGRRKISPSSKAAV